MDENAISLTLFSTGLSLSLIKQMKLTNFPIN